MKRGACFGGSAAAANAALATDVTGFATEGAGRAAEGGATVCRGPAAVAWVGGITGRATAEGWAARCVTAFSTSPGLEMCDRSSLGLNSSAGAREARLVPGSACPAKYFLTRSASSTSMELECVFFSVTPTLMRASRIALLFTSSSLARSLIRIFCIPPYCLRVVPPEYAFIASSVRNFAGPQQHPWALLSTSARQVLLRRKRFRFPRLDARASSP